MCGETNWSVGLYEEDEIILAAWPFYLKKKYGIEYITMPPLTPYLGIVASDVNRTRKNSTRFSKEKKIINYLLNQLPRVRLVTCHFYPGFLYGLPLIWSGFSQSTRYTYRMDLSLAPEEVWQLMDSEQRNRIRRATESITVKEGEDTELFMRLNRASFAKSGNDIPYTESWFKSFDLELKKRKKRKIFFAYDRSGKPCAANYTVFDSHTAYCLGIGMDIGAEKGANALLMWQVIEHYLTGPQTIFDFEGGNIERIERFFRSFGGELQTYSRFHKQTKWMQILLSIIGK